MDQQEILKIVEQYIVLIRQHYSPRKIIFFGSYAKGLANQNFAVIVDEIIGDYLDNTFLLYKLRRDVDDRIEPVLLESKNDPSGFLKEIMKTGQVVFEAA
jgi:predicted nucleotidyltransferase